jgi:hypothetical protein
MHGQYSEMIGKGKERKATTFSKRPNDARASKPNSKSATIDLVFHSVVYLLCTHASPKHLSKMSQLH